MTFINYIKGYRLSFTNSALKELNSIDNRYYKTILQKLRLLLEGTEGLDIKRLAAKDRPTFRLRVGIYRVTFEVHEGEITVLVIGVNHRQEAYKA